MSCHRIKSAQCARPVVHISLYKASCLVLENLMSIGTKSICMQLNTHTHTTAYFPLIGRLQQSVTLEDNNMLALLSEEESGTFSQQIYHSYTVLIQKISQLAKLDIFGLSAYGMSCT